MKTSSSLRIEHGMISILLSCFLLRYFSSRALTTGVRLRVCVRANRVHICIPASWDTEEAYVGFSATCGARPHINLRFPTCYDAVRRMKNLSGKALKTNRKSIGGTCDVGNEKPRSCWLKARRKSQRRARLSLRKFALHHSTRRTTSPSHLAENGFVLV